jgi:5-oxoprolinase (ATP-hydrolysing)
MSEQTKKWRFAIDRGGTFTDVVALDPEGNFTTLKLLSDSPQYSDASIEGIRRILGLRTDEPLPEDRIAGIRFGTTIATNALIERKGGKVALLITKGFSDLLDIGYQNRPDIFKLCIKKSPPLYSTVIEADERIDCHGRVIRELNARDLSREIEKLRNAGVETIAVVLMHSWKNPAHELLCGTIAKKSGFASVLLSHRTVNLIKVVSRGQSTLVDAYLSTVLADYLKEIQKETGGIPVQFMQSNGALSPPFLFTGKSALLSGPAGGVTAVAGISEEIGIKGVIGFDMGGTSTDVSRFEGELERIHEKTIDGINLQAEMLNIVTVAAGGGSILDFDGRKMIAGPESAGSYPGPACYGFGGPLTITDANLLTGRLIPAFFPKTFGTGRNAPLDPEIVAEKFVTLTDEINNALGISLIPQKVASGFLRIANEKMATAIKEISVSKGFDVREYALVCFGGAGGQHACPIASLLDIDTIIIHPLSSVMSAYGIGLARPAWKAEKTVLMQYDEETHDRLDFMFKEMESNLFGSEHKIPSSPHLPKDGREDFCIKRELDLRPKGTETFLTLEYMPFKETVAVFREKFERLFGFIHEGTELEVVNLRIEIRESAEFFSPYKEKEGTHETMVLPTSFQEIFYEEGPADAPVFMRENLPLDAKIKGPSLIIDNNSTVVIDPGFEAEIGIKGIIVMRKLQSREASVCLQSGSPDPVLLEVFNNLFVGIASEMGITLKNTAHSVNIKERLDFSCAVFDPDGNLVANAPHIPVHLGSMADTVKTILYDNPISMRAGDVYLTNNPYRGGSHLPDMTVICPVFSEYGKLIFFTASRGHHADVGGITPGSMPPSASHIDEEGVLVNNLLLVRDGIFRENVLERTLTKHKYPVRNVSERISDLRAQIAACRKGMNELMQVISRYGITVVADYMRYIQDNAVYSVKQALQRFLKGGNHFYSAFEDFLDDGTPIKATISIDAGSHPPETLSAIIDFTGTGPQHMNDNLNAPFSVTRSAVMYVLRALINADIQLNSGCLKPVNIIIPERTLLSPAYPAPVASGNVETSQRIVDVLLGAFGVAAASQGTMNNLLFEAEGESPYYETIAGGSGALDGCPGASGVQVHMTNTRITDPEILEIRHPGIRLERFTLRKHSGGKGKFPGGDGVIREIKFLKPATVSILSERRVYGPYGIKGGEAGAKGLNLLRKANGERSALGHREVLKVDKDDSIIIETPGGGGYGQG